MEKSINQLKKVQSWNFKLQLIEQEREAYSDQINRAHQQLFVRNPFVRDWFFDFGDIDQEPKWLK